MLTRGTIQWGVWISATVLLLSQLMACGSGGNNLAGGGIGGTGIVAAGTVTAKGSIFVNGIEYRVAGASFERDGVIETLSEDEQSTREGMVLEVKGTLDDDGPTGQATEILFRDLVEGTIDSSLSSSADIKVLTILAQTVVVTDGLTRFATPLDFADIEAEPGFLEVAGFRRADGRIQATYIELKDNGQFEVVGEVSALDAAGFTIGELRVSDSSQPQPQVGDLVKVEGDSYVPATRTLTATSFSLRPAGLSVAVADRAEVEGFVSGGSGAIAAEVLFQVAGQDVLFTAATEFDGGTAADLINNTKVEAEGPLVDGVLRAEKIEFKQDLKFQGVVSAVTGNSLTLRYPDALTGTTAVEVRVDPAVTEEDTPFAELIAGDRVKLEGQLLGGGTALATRLRELEPGDSKIILQAPLESFDAATGLLRLRGVTIDSSGLSFSAEDLPLSQADFFAALEVGILIKAEGDQPQRWDELELER